jgi:bifunctional enzyme CysN/CysC
LSTHTEDGVVTRGVVSGEIEDAAVPHSPNVTRQDSRLTRGRRWETLRLAGATVWFTGLPAAGKSTIAGAVEERLVTLGRPALMLDGDDLRHGLNGDLGFDEAARSENVRRTAHVARLLAEAGTIAVVSLVSPYARDREAAATLHTAIELPFIEVFVDAPLDLCEQRDPKGLYARAREGELAGLTGVGAPYEAPTRPDLALHTDSETVEIAVERVMQALVARLRHPLRSDGTRPNVRASGSAHPESAKARPAGALRA